jgi:hypothetical protein
MGHPERLILPVHAGIVSGIKIQNREQNNV